MTLAAKKRTRREKFDTATDNATHSAIRWFEWLDLPEGDERIALMEKLNDAIGMSFDSVDTEEGTTRSKQEWAIVNTGETGGAGLFWSNEYGWVSGQDATIFDGDERRSVNLPMEGRWHLLTKPIVEVDTAGGDSI